MYLEDSLSLYSHMLGSPFTLQRVALQESISVVWGRLSVLGKAAVTLFWEITTLVFAALAALLEQLSGEAQELQLCPVPSTGVRD